MEFWTQHGAAILRSLATNSVYVITVGLFIVAIFRCITPVAKCRMQLKRAIRKIKRGDKSDVWQDKNFLADPYSDPSGRFAPYFYWTKDRKASNRSSGSWRPSATSSSAVVVVTGEHARRGTSAGLV